MITLQTPQQDADCPHCLIYDSDRRRAYRSRETHRAPPHERKPCVRMPSPSQKNRPRWCGGRFELSATMETAGIEPASAVARKVASTSVAGALVSPSTRLAGGVVESQLRKMSSIRLERTSPSEPAI